MGFDRLRLFWRETYITATPVLSPASAGRAMMVNPKIVVAHLLMLLIGDSHDPECGCEVCNYRMMGNGQGLDAAPPSQQEREPATSARAAGSLGCLIDIPYELTNVDAWYWTQWMADHFPSMYTTWDQLSETAAVLDEMSEPQAGNLLLDRVIAASSNDSLLQPIITDFLEDGVLELDDPQDGFEALHYLADQVAGLVGQG